MNIYFDYFQKKSGPKICSLSSSPILYISFNFYFVLFQNSHITDIKEKYHNATRNIEFEIEKFNKNVNKYSLSLILLLLYKIDNEDKIKIFGEEFVGNNGNKYSIIYKDIIFPLQSYFLIKDINKEDKENKKFEILLLELEDITDRSYIFYNCILLVEFVEYDNFYEKIY